MSERSRSARPSRSSTSKATRLAGSFVRSSAATSLRPCRVWKSVNGTARPLENARTSPSRTKLPGTARSGATSSGYRFVIRSIVREYSSTRSPALCTWARMPSYLSSTTYGGGKRRPTSARSRTGVASITPIGAKCASVGSPSVSWRARSAVAPMSPVSMCARPTASRSRPKARAIASSRRPSRRPMRVSPETIFTMYRASSPLDRARSARSSSRFGPTPRAAAIASNVATTSARLTRSPRGGSSPMSSAATSPRSACRWYDAAMSSPVLPERSRSTSESALQPTESTRSSRRGKGAPARSRAAMTRSPSSRLPR